jgi:hypothetical protein
MLVDDAMDDTVQPSHRSPIPEISGNWNRVGNSKRTAKARCDLPGGIVERAADRFDLAGDVGVEQHLRDDQQREAHQLVVHVDRVAVAPSVERPLGVAHHHVAVRRNAVAMERRLRQATLTQPEVALAREQAVAEDAANVSPEERVLDEVLVVRHQDLLDVLRITEHEGRPSREAQEGDIPMVSRARDEQPEDVGSELGKVPEQEVAFGTGRATESGHGVSTGTPTV